MLFLIYSKENCIYCTRAKQWLDDLFGIDTRYYVEFCNPPGHVVEQLKESTGQKTYPFIFCGNTFVGGYTELDDYFKTTKLIENEYGIKVDNDF